MSMYCPMKFNSKTLDANGDLLNNVARCEEAECAWWIPATGSCAIVAISWHLNTVAENIGLLNDNLVEAGNAIMEEIKKGE